MESEYDRWMRQAPSTVKLYLVEAIEIIDSKLGKGYAKQHPELVAAFITSCSIDYGTTIIHASIESVATSLDAVALSVDKHE